MLKQGVDLQGVAPEIAIAYSEASFIFHDHGYQAVMTSCRDSKHGAKSLHRYGLAVDMRTKHVPRPMVTSVVEDIKDALGPAGFDIILEDFNGPNEHLHIEYDP